MSGEIKQCLFCDIQKGLFIAENEYAFAIRDGFPVTKMHSLIIPKRHIVDYFGLTDAELLGGWHGREGKRAID
jgi:diadenosine tetraphosphate (Ap4A) HIT family hydrolase